ncbi:MAG: hypothetical protein ACI8QC_003330 [Planctomycetota bacterium]|jgi:hypothetical protein
MLMRTPRKAWPNWKRTLGIVGLVAAIGATAKAQGGSVLAPPQQEMMGQVRDPAVEFLKPYGLQNFSPHYVDALSALLRAQTEFDRGHYPQAKAILDLLWAAHPPGGPHWGVLQTQPFGINIGSPPSYYGLRMLTDTTEWRVANPNFGGAQRRARLTVLLVGSTSGIEPQDLQDIQQGTGVAVQHTLHPKLLQGGSRVVHDSLHLFREYVTAMTGGALEVETSIMHLPNLDMDVHAEALPGRYFAGLTDPSSIWATLPQADIAATDWWWIIYPSHVPEQYPDFQGAEFVTGGMGTGAVGPSPFFIIDDRWLVRKPPHIGTGLYSKIERETYLPQWLQHEFFHHLFRTYPEFGLEDTPHQWFNPANWPADFDGRYEADYFHEALYKRLITATPPLVSALRYATDDAPWGQFTVSDLLGIYQRQPVLNNWHTGSIQFGPVLEWQNQAGVDWNLQPEITNGRFLLGPDCPYYGLGWYGRKFDIVLERDDLGDFLPAIRGFSFTGELYKRL